MHQQYNPANVVVAVAGNVTHQQVLDLVGGATSDWEARQPLDWEPVIDSCSGPVVRVEQRRTDQTHLCLALPGLSLDDPDRYALALLNVMLGDGMSSRLFLNLRERQSLAYEVSSSTSYFRDCGSLVVYCGVEPKKSWEAVRAVVEELKGFDHEVPAEELAKAKEYSKGRLLLRMEDTRAVASWLASQELLQCQVATPDDVVRQLDAVTTADTARVAQRLFDESRLRLAVVGRHRSDRAFLKLLRF
jgi:predicted Zn-dependent peptidase